MTKVTRFFIGVDLHKTVIQICVLGRTGDIVEEARHLAYNLDEGHAVIAGLKKYRRSGRVCVESVGVNRWFVNHLIEDGFDVVVCDPVKLNLRMLGSKTDRKDALEIARRLQLGDIDRNALTFYPSDELYGKRKLLRTRHSLMQMRQQVINQIRSCLNAYKITGFGVELTSKASIAHLKSLSWSSSELKIVVDTLVQTMVRLGESIEVLQKEILQMTKEPLTKAIKEALPQVGPLTANVLVHELGDVSRFRNTRAVAKYAGLVPRVTQSADKSHHGRLTKRGNRELRYILVEWAMRMIRYNEQAQKWAAPMLKRMNKHKVRIALARRLLIGFYKMLQTGEVFSVERCLGQ